MKFSTIWTKLKEMIQKMIGPKTVEQVLHITPAISNEMTDAIELWGDMYENKAPWLHEPSYNDPTRVTSLGLPALIASEKARMALLEMESEITAPTEEIEKENPDYVPGGLDALGNFIPPQGQKTIIEEKPKGPTERAEFLNKQYEKLKKAIRTQIEYGIAKGGLVIKPYIIINKPKEIKGVVTSTEETTTAQIEFDYVQADGFYPLSFDGSGRVIEAAFVQRKVDKDVTYSRLEYHKLEGNTVTVQNKAFKSTNTNQMGSESMGDLGSEIPLTEVPEWADLQPETTIKGVDRLLFGYFKMPEANTIDTYSPLGVSGYSRVVDLIRDADEQYSRLKWEFEGSELAIDIDRDALNDVEYTDSNGVTRSMKTMNRLQQRLFRPIDLGTSDTYQPYSPAIRDASLINGLNAILMRIEDATGLSRGTLSDVSAEARTATELKILKQRSYSANAEIQKAIEDTLRDVVYIMNVYCTLYQVVPEGEYDVSFEWDDSILVDTESELNKRLSLLNSGLTSKIELRMWYFGETEKQAREALAKVQEENKSAMEDNLMMQQGFKGMGE